MSWKRWYKEAMYKQVVFSPWTGYGDFGEDFGIDEKARTVVSHDRVWILYSFLKNVLQKNIEGEIWECGVYKGGTSMVMANLLNRTKSNKTLRLFDSFEGMPQTDPNKDAHNKGDFYDTNYNDVKIMIRYGNLVIHKGYIPLTFSGLEQSKIALVHSDVDIYKSVIDVCEYTWDKIVDKGVMIVDDYGFAQTRGCLEAIDEFFADKATPIILPTGQAIIIKG